MSLVAYADSEASSDEESTGPKEVPLNDTVEKKEVSKSQEKLAREDGTLGVKIEAKEVDTNEETTKPKSIGNLFSSLPAPWMSGVTWASKGKAGKLKKFEKQTVKISLPVAEESDSDDETLANEKKKQITSSQKASGLFGLLPKPKNSVTVKENNPNRPVAKISNRPLIPDSLRRKQAKKAPNPQKNHVSSHDSDDEDDEDLSFFTFNAKEPSAVIGQTHNKDVKLGSAAISSKPSVSHHDDTPINIEDSLTPPKPLLVHTEEPSQDHLTSNLVGPQLTTTYTYPATEGSSSLQNQNSFTGMTENQRNVPEYYNSMEPNPNCSYMPNYDYNYAQTDTQNVQYHTEWQPQVEPTRESSQHQQKEQLKKLQGKRGRGEEHINIIDVNADEQVGPVADWKTRYKKDDTGYQPQSKKKGNLPSSQQRRKHQITYLAFQAKETEWELRNQWAKNSQTRRQTQSKYGF